MKKRYLISLIVFTYLIVILSMYYSLTIISKNLTKYNQEMLLETESNQECLRDDLVNISLCLRDNLKQWYNYNLSNTGKELTFKELTDLGGVCSHYAEWYKQELIKLGGTYLDDENKKFNQKNESKFYITKNHIPVKKDLGHIYTVVSDSNHYCVLDQLNVNCWGFKQ